MKSLAAASHFFPVLATSLARPRVVEETAENKSRTCPPAERDPYSCSPSCKPEFALPLAAGGWPEVAELPL
jgi:hypothetical protein